MSHAADHWASVASRWAQVGSPLRPSADDIEIYSSLLPAAPFRALILGVTPELREMVHDNDGVAHAADHTEAMIGALWPGEEGTAYCCEWTRLPFAKSRFDLVLCDGGFHLVSCPKGQQLLLSEVRRVLRPGGAFLTRLFTPPEARESTDNVLEDLAEGAIPNLNVLKLRLGMSLQRTPEDGVCLHEIWKTSRDFVGDFNQFADSIGWERAHLSAIETYRECYQRYHFVSLDGVADMLTVFEVDAPRYGSYDLADRCPILRASVPRAQ